MTIELIHNTVDGILETRATGTLTLDDVSRYYEDVLAAEVEAPGFRELVDLTAADMTTFPSVDMPGITDSYLSICDKLNLEFIRVAILSPKDLNFGMGRIFHARTDDPRIEVEVHRERRQAIDFLTGRKAD